MPGGLGGQQLPHQTGRRAADQGPERQGFRESVNSSQGAEQTPRPLHLELRGQGDPTDLWFGGDCVSAWVY